MFSRLQRILLIVLEPQRHNKADRLEGLKRSILL